MKKVILFAIVALAFLASSTLIGFLLKLDSEVSPEICRGTAACFRGKVTAITDGDTIKVEGNVIRLALSSAPELHEVVESMHESLLYSFVLLEVLLLWMRMMGKGKAALGEL